MPVHPSGSLSASLGVLAATALLIPWLGAGCECGSPLELGACNRAADCLADGDPCTTEYCTDRGVCATRPSTLPECLDVGPMPDAPGADTPGADVPAVDAPACTVDCDDHDVCTDDACVGAECVHTPFPGCRERHAALLLADSQRVMAGSPLPVLSGGIGAAANVIVPTEATEATFTVLGGSTLTEGTTFTSELGASPITLSSSLQTVTATHDGAVYALGGLVGAAVFATSDTLTVSATPPGGPLSVPVAAPAPITAASDLLDPPSGLTSTVSWPDGACDAFLVQATLSGSALPGLAQVLRRVPCDEAPLEGGRRRTRILDDATLAALTARGLTISEITVGVVNEADCSGFFPGLGEVSCQAGRLLRFGPSALLPPVPPPCGDAVTFAGNVEIRWDADAMSCDIIRTGDGGATGIDVARIDTRTGNSVWRYTPLTASHGTISGMRIDGMPLGTDITVTLREPFGALLTITFRIEADTLSVSAFDVT